MILGFQTVPAIDSRPRQSAVALPHHLRRPTQKRGACPYQDQEQTAKSHGGYEQQACAARSNPEGRDGSGVAARRSRYEPVGAGFACRARHIDRNARLDACSLPKPEGMRMTPSALFKSRGDLLRAMGPLQSLLATLAFSIAACSAAHAPLSSTSGGSSGTATTGGSASSSSGTSSAGGSSGSPQGLLTLCASDAGLPPVCGQTLTDPFNCGACGNVCPNQIPTSVPTTDAWGCSYGTCVPVSASQPDPCVSKVLSDGGEGCFPGQTLCPDVPEDYAGNNAHNYVYTYATQNLASCDCTDVMSDRSNCGACGITCTPGQTCASGSCAPCPPGQVEDLTFLSLQAGVPPSCRAGGSPPEVSFGGYLVTSTVCPATASAGAYWATLDVDPSNCGSCGHACGNDQLCFAGVCTSPCDPPYDGTCVAGTDSPDGGLSCPAGLSACSTTSWCRGCIDDQTDSLNCGGCGQRCPVGAPICVGGQCTTGCGGGQLCAYAPIITGSAGACVPSCPTLFGVQMISCGTPPYCTVSAADPNNCGSCGRVCANDQRCWGGECLKSCENDELICGSVAIFCPFGTTCLVADAGCGQVCEYPPGDPNPICFSACCAPSCPTGQVCNGQVCVSSCGQ